MSECSDQEEVPPVVTLWERQWSREELLAGMGRLEQVAGMRLVDGGNGERGRTGRATAALHDRSGLRRRNPADRQLRAPEEVSDGKR